MDAATILRLYGRLYPAREYELDAGVRTGRTRRAQFERPMRNMCVLPSKRVVMQFTQSKYIKVVKPDGGKAS